MVGFESGGISLTDPFFKGGLVGNKSGSGNLSGFVSWMNAEKDKGGQEIRKGTSGGTGDQWQYFGQPDMP